MVSTLLGVYFGGSLVLLFFWVSNKNMPNEESSFYKSMIFIWPISFFAIVVYRVFKYAMESNHV